MKAIIRKTYGTPDVLQMQEVEKPVPKDDEVLVKIRAASLNSLDWRFLKADPFLIRLDSGLMKPKNRILGLDVAGEIETVGSRVMQYQPDDAVFADILDLRGGALAEYVCIPERLLVPKPTNLTFEESAAMPLVGITAVQALVVQGKLQAGQKVLVYGASGGVGTVVVQLAKALGAEVTAVCSTRNVQLVRKLGADTVIDYQHEDFSQRREQYDLIIGVNGYQPIGVFKRALRPVGVYILVGGSGVALFQATVLGSWMSRSGNQQMGAMNDPKDRGALLESVAELIEERMIAPVIDRCYPLDEVREAFRYLGEGRAQGKVIISMNQ